MVCPIGENRIVVNGKNVDVDAAAVVVDNRTYLPIRCVLEAIGGMVDWNNTTSTVVVARGETDVLLAQEKFRDSADYECVIFHELCHMFSNIPQTSKWFRKEITGI